MDQNQNQQQAEPQNQPAPSATGGRKVFGVDGKPPISEHEFVRQSWDPALVEQADKAYQAAQQRQQAQAPASAQPSGGELEELRRQYAELQAQHNEISQYGGIINALKSDPDLVATMQKAIAGELYDIEKANKKRKDAEFGDSFRDPDDEDDDAPNRRLDPQSQRQREQEIARRAAREAELRIEMQTVMREMMQTGASEEEVNRFIAFVNQPGGLTMHDLLSVYHSRGTKGQPPQPPAPQKQAPPAPLASAPGQTDRPKGEARYQNHEDGAGRYFPGNANAY